jgi:hypothetical protein
MCQEPGLTGFGHLLSQLYGIALDYQVQVEVGITQEQVSDYTANEVHLLPQPTSLSADFIDQLQEWPGQILLYLPR